MRCSTRGVRRCARNDQDRRDEENRLWAHGLHTDNSIVQRGNLAEVWGYVSGWGVQYLRHVQKAAVDRLPEYKQTRETWRSRMRVSALNMFT